MKTTYAIALMATTAALSLGSAALVLTSQATPAAPVSVSTQSTPAPVPSNSDDRNRDLYLDDLRTQGIPTSVGGGAEVRIAAGVCDQLAAGTPQTSLINDLNATYAPLTGVNAYYYSVAIVDAAARDYCVR